MRGFFNMWTLFGLIISTALTVGIWTVVGYTPSKSIVSKRHIVMFSRVEPNHIVECSPTQTQMTFMVHYKAFRSELATTTWVNRWVTNEVGLIVASTVVPGNKDKKTGEYEGWTKVIIPCLPVGVYTHSSISINRYNDGGTSIIPSPESKFTIIPRD
jgi:hypothetical protein